ncbi:MAG: septation protein SpoVG family protein [Rhodospirillales bacterium]|nr:septation protein SpoVG family protein [Rhodospirillales bacterium]
MKISEVNIILIKPRNGLIGFASLVINDALYLGSIGIHQKLNGNGYRLTYPTKKTGTNNMDIFHPINREAGKAIETAILTKLNDVMNRLDDVGYDCDYAT